jgi:hypothetical protein
MHPISFSMSLWLRRTAICQLFLLLALPGFAGAIERTLTIKAPTRISSGQAFTVTVSAGTDAGQGEQVGFLQVEASVDGGKTWSALFYLQKSGSKVTQQSTLTAGLSGSSVQVRARAAFRDGLAGDVDYRGGAIRWEESWKDWQEPPAKIARITVNTP